MKSQTLQVYRSPHVSTVVCHGCHDNVMTEIQNRSIHKGLDYDTCHDNLAFIELRRTLMRLRRSILLEKQTKLSCNDDSIFASRFCLWEIPGPGHVGRNHVKCKSMSLFLTFYSPMTTGPKPQLLVLTGHASTC